MYSFILSYRLWLDVGIKRYTTLNTYTHIVMLLWFDVGIKRYTTRLYFSSSLQSCGLM